MRKVLGAGRFNLVNLLAGEYIKLMAISAVLAIPATFGALDSWLSLACASARTRFGTCWPPPLPLLFAGVLLPRWPGRLQDVNLPWY